MSAAPLLSSSWSASAPMAEVPASEASALAYVSRSAEVTAARSGSVGDPWRGGVEVEHAERQVVARQRARRRVGQRDPAQHAAGVARSCLQVAGDPAGGLRVADVDAARQQRTLGEVAAGAAGRADRGDDCEQALLPQAVQRGEGGMEPEHAVEREHPVGRHGDRATPRVVLGLARGHDGRERVEPAVELDEDEGVGGLGGEGELDAPGADRQRGRAGEEAAA